MIPATYTAPFGYYPGSESFRAIYSAGAKNYDKLFLRIDGQDVRSLPKQKHPKTGEHCFDWGPGMWPQNMID